MSAMKDLHVRGLDNGDARSWAIYYDLRPKLIPVYQEPDEDIKLPVPDKPSTMSRIADLKRLRKMCRSVALDPGDKKGYLLLMEHDTVEAAYFARTGKTYVEQLGLGL
jgi:hypothetical protein